MVGMRATSLCPLFLISFGVLLTLDLTIVLQRNMQAVLMNFLLDIFDDLLGDVGGGGWLSLFISSRPT